ncbi:MAG: VOC family protein, partial [Chloroflexota bacterium]|nr:VOC family protein [Chloroflexota bacterium]
MKVKRIDHVGVVVRNMKEAISFYEDTFGATAGTPMERPDLGVTITQVKLGDGELELFCPLEQRPAGSTGEAMQEFLDTRGEGIHHVAFAV